MLPLGFRSPILLQSSVVIRIFRSNDAIAGNCRRVLSQGHSYVELHFTTFE